MGRASWVRAWGQQQAAAAALTASSTRNSTQQGLQKLRPAATAVATGTRAFLTATDTSFSHLPAQKHLGEGAGHASGQVVDVELHQLASSGLR